MISNKITTCKEGKLYEYEYVLPDDTFVGTSRPEHASVFRTSDWNPNSSRFPPPDHTVLCGSLYDGGLTKCHQVVYSGLALASQPRVFNNLVVSPPRLKMVGSRLPTPCIAAANRNNVSLGRLPLSLSLLNPS
jgi:hypothetical protein